MDLFINVNLIVVLPSDSMQLFNFIVSLIALSSNGSELGSIFIVIFYCSLSQSCVAL